MIEIESLSDFIDSEQYLKLVSQIYVLLDSCRDDYANLDNWFFSQFLSKIEDVEADVLFVRQNNQVIGILCLELMPKARIITLLVKKEYRNQQIGTSLLETIFSILETDKPEFVCPISKLGMYKPFIQKYYWQANK